jgi:rhamnose utilization protein RhaD (predicted bifunctional aldolase and dehydrogenase)/NAD(P)-dependent dehydrogenase (short-subunit alcohol dehydrogenase family)
MKSLWNNSEAKKFGSHPLALRVYTSQLLGREPDLVLHGGGNTSVKTQVKNIYGELEDVLYVKGSGWDLETIKPEGFAPVKLDALLKMAKLPSMTDTEMVTAQRVAMTDPNAPNPSVEAILHAIIPFRFVDHTHADSVVTITNTPDGIKRIKDVYKDRVLYIPYVMPGFILARKVYEMTQGLDWKKYEGMVLLHHGIFTFHDDSRKSYEKMIELVTKAENYLKEHKAIIKIDKTTPKEDLLTLAQIRQSVSRAAGRSIIAKLEQGDHEVSFSNLKNVSSIATRGPLTPDHVIRTKPKAFIVGHNLKKSLESFAGDYEKYYKRNKESGMTQLDLAPRWGVWPGHGTICFGTSYKESLIISDIISHTIKAIQQAETLGGWKALSEKDVFDVEYWELEQAKLKKAGKGAKFQGKIALVTGAASGIGKACVEGLHSLGACVVALDINPKLKGMFGKKEILEIVCDLTKPEEINLVIQKAVRAFGGLDIVVSNAGIFPPSATLESMNEGMWQKSMDINLTSHQNLIKSAIPFLKLGIDPTIIMIASKNVPAPGPGAGAYSVAKAGLTQLARVAALELAPSGIRVNVLHPNQVFDTAIWTKDVLEKRAKHYGVSVEEYKKSNLLKTEITSIDVARLVCTMAGDAFAKTTGAQIPIDGGNERVI